MKKITRYSQLSRSINSKAIAHAKKILGDKQFSENKGAVKSIVADFKAGAKELFNLIFVS